jgi:para-nitrobenzyl esterase
MFRLVRQLIAVALAALAICAALASPGQAGTSDPLRVDPPAGPVQGVRADGTVQFRGIPYAEPPVGDLRWRPPVAQPAWTGLRDASRFGPQCAQINTLATFAGPPNNNEDCLSLNVYAPERAKPTAKLPVIVWFHGGGNFAGSGDAYDGSGLVKTGNVIVVTLNYRLGVLGWLAHPELDREGHLFANYGLLDQQMALRWVQANVAAFGGDPGNVTIGGQSAGSLDVQAHMTSPFARGLFDRAIMQSGVNEPTPLAQAEALGARFAAEAGCGDGAPTAECLRKLPVERLMAVQGVTGEYPTTDGVVADGKIVPAEGLLAAFRARRFTPVPVLSSSTRDEWNFLTGVQHYASGRTTPLTAADYDAFIAQRAGGDPDLIAEIRARYPLTEYATPQRAISAIGTQGGLLFQCATRQRLAALQEVAPVYAYQFNDRTAPSYLPAMSGFEPLADHTADIQYLFPGFHGGALGVRHSLNREQTALSHRLMSAWTNFARTGNPNGSKEVAWPNYNLSGPAAVALVDTHGQSAISDKQFSAANQCSFWDRLGK